MTKKYEIEGVDCPSCAKMVEIELEDCGIKCSCSFEKETIEIEGIHKAEDINNIISKLGCRVSITKK